MSRGNVLGTIHDDDALYTFDDKAISNPNPPGTAAGRNFVAPAGFQPAALGARGPPTGMRGGRMPTAMGQGGRAASRMGTAVTGEGGRPMTSVAGAGYQSNARRAVYDPLGQGGKAPRTLKKVEKAPEDLVLEMETGVHRLIERAAASLANQDENAALQEAKAAVAEERKVVRFREQRGLADQQINFDLGFAARFTLAHAQATNGMAKEALGQYAALIANKQYNSPGRMRVNMGNLLYEQGKYREAIKMYRMAVDQVPNESRQLQDRMQRNLANAWVKLREFREAARVYEMIMEANPDMETAFNVIVCHYSLGDAGKMQEFFARMLDTPIPGVGIEEEEEEEDAALRGPAPDAGDGLRAVDLLSEEVKVRKKRAQELVSRAARLIAPELDKEDWVRGFDRVISLLEAAPSTFRRVGVELEMCKANTFLRRKEFDKAVEVLMSFEKKDQALAAQAATNLSFLYFLKGDFEEANRKADVALRQQRYSAKALVNKGNCLFMEGDYDQAKERYLEAIGVQSECVEAIYNLGLVNRRLAEMAPDGGALELSEAGQAFEKLKSTTLARSPEVAFQIAQISEARGDDRAAMKHYRHLQSLIPTDPGVHLRLGQLYSKIGEDAQAEQCYKDAHDLYPVNLDVISWLGVTFVKNELYEEAIRYFETAASIQPQEVKWRLMVASCHRRTHELDKAHALYQEIHRESPENTECLRYLVTISKELGLPYDGYQQELAELERNAAIHAGGQAQSTYVGNGGQSQYHDHDDGDDGQGGVPIPGGAPSPGGVPVPIPAAPESPMMAAPAHSGGGGGMGHSMRGGSASNGGVDHEEHFADDDVDGLLGDD